MLRFMGSQQVGHDLATEQQQSRVYGICDFSTRNLNSSSELYVIKWLCYEVYFMALHLYGSFPRFERSLIKFIFLILFLVF